MKRLPAAALTLAPALIVAVLVATRISTDIPFDSDEANHANLGLRQFQDLRDGAFIDFVRHSYRTGQFPFLHGWTLLPWFTVFGATVFAARVAQCAAFVVGAAATAWAAWRAAGDDVRAGALAGWLFALSPALAAYSGLCMLETPGAAATALTLAVFAEACRCEGRRATLLHLATAAAALATYFVKLNYGLWIIPAILAGHAVRAVDPARRREALRHAAVYGAAIVAVAAAWYSTPSQREAFAGFLHNPAQEVPREMDDPSFAVPGFRFGNLIAYLRLIPVHFHPHWIVGAVVFLNAAMGLTLWRRPAVAAAATCLAWTWVVLSMGFREYPMARFIASALPALWIVAAAGWAQATRNHAGSRLVAVWGGLLVVAGVVAQAAALPDRLREEYEVDARFEPVFAFVEEGLEGPASVMFVNYTDHTSVRTMTWRMWSRTSYRDWDLKGLIAERIFESDARFESWMADDRPWGDGSWRSFVVEFAPGPDYLDAPVVQPATVALWHDAVARHGDRLELTAERRFDALDLTVRLWRDRAPPPHRGLSGGR